MRTRKLGLALALSATLVAGVAACGSPSQKGGSANASGSASAAGAQAKLTDAKATGPAKDIKGATKGGNVTVYSASTPTGFDPTDIYYTDSNEITKLTFRTLTQFDIRDGKPTLVPDMATDLGKVSDDGLTWTFTLKDGLKYDDGSPVTSKDFAYSIKRSFAHDVYSNGPTYQLEFFKDGDKYKGPYTSGDNYAGVDTPDDKTLVIHLVKKFPDLAFYTTFPMFTPIPQAKDTKENYQNAPLSTGPYKWSSFTSGTELKLVKNDNWDAKSDPVRHQYVDSWDFKWGDDTIKAQTQVLESNGPDASAIQYESFDSSLLPQLTADKKAQLIQGPGVCNIVFQLDSRKIPLEVRKAVLTAYPVADVMKVGGQSDLNAIPSSGILPPAVPGYAKYDLPGFKAGQAGDPVAAKKMLTDAGKVGFELSWYFAQDNPIAAQTSDIRKQKLEAAGFTVRAVGVPKAGLRKATANYDADVNSGQAPRGWCSDWPSGSSWIPVLFKSNSIANGSSWGMLQDPALDKKIDDANGLPSDQALPKWTALDKEIMTTYVPAVPVYYDKASMIVGKSIGGAIDDTTMSMPFFPNIFVKK